MTKAQEVHEKVEAMIAAGTPKADAFKELADEYGQPVNSIRGSYYSHKKVLDGGSDGSGAPRRPRRRETTPADAIESAVATLRRSIETIDAEVEAARGRADEAVREHAALADSADARKAEIEKKIAALTS